MLLSAVWAAEAELWTIAASRSACGCLFHDSSSLLSITTSSTRPCRYYQKETIKNILSKEISERKKDDGAQSLEPTLSPRPQNPTISASQHSSSLHMTRWRGSACLVHPELWCSAHRNIAKAAEGELMSGQEGLAEGWRWLCSLMQAWKAWCSDRLGWMPRRGGWLGHVDAPQQASLYRILFSYSYLVASSETFCLTSFLFYISAES